MSACTVFTSSGIRCGAEAVASWESRISGAVFGECAAHHVPVSEAASVVGSRVSVQWHSWTKPGVVVAEKGRSVVVRFVPRAGADPIERAFPVEDVRF